MSNASPPDGMRIGINGLILRYYDWGNPHLPSVLLLHGFLSHSLVWCRLAETLRSEHHVIALDQRGHGGSGWAENGNYSIDDHFCDLAAFIDHLDLHNLVIIGHSMGGRNGLFYAACRPERVSGLVLVDARPGNTDESIQALRRLLDAFRGYQTSHQIGQKDVTAIQSTSAYRYDPSLIAGAVQAGYQVEPLWPFMEGLACVTLVIRGQMSRFVSAEEAKLMSRLIPNAKLAEIKGASHLPMFEAPKQFAQAIHSFLRELRD